MNINADRFGPWAVVTGASSGIGREFADQAASAGINVVLIARRLATLHEIGADLASRYGIDYRAVGVDLSEPGPLAPIVDATAELDVGLLISNAGEANPGAFLYSDLFAQESIVRLNTTAHLDLTHHFAQRLARRGRGGIVLVSALGATYGIPYNANTGATKAYVASLGEALHVELGKHGVHVTVLLPGPTRTSDLAELGIEASKLPIPIMPVERCVRETLQALARNRSHYIPGRVNRMMIALVPPRLTRTMMAALMSHHDRAATYAQ
jgi:short-subunit dehydrogenase